jgi:multidrug transporter EmrE-like cation transporter
MNKSYLYVIGIIIILVVFESIALYGIKHAKTEKKWIYVSMAIYGLIVPLLLYKAVHYEGIGIVNFFWNVFSTIMGFIIGIYLFGEKVDNIQWLGVIVSIVGMALILLSKK